MRFAGEARSTPRSRDNSQHGTFMSLLHGVRTAGATLALVVLSATSLAGQTGYPSFQVPRVVDREYNFAVADGDAQTSVIFQWRESAGLRSQLSFDVGIADNAGGNADASFLLGGQYAYQVGRARADMPLDLLFTVGIFTDLGNGRSIFSIPAGLSIGHRFELDGSLAITPYAHPRLALTSCSRCGGHDTDIDVALDLGGSLDLTRNLALRASALLSDDTVIGISLAWRPSSLQRVRR
jgi:hypothetical protein